MISRRFITISENNSRGIGVFSLEVGFLVVGGLNLISLIPSFFSVIGGILSLLGIIIWLRYFLSLVIMDENMFLSNLVPDCPLVMVPFVFVIEVVSYFVRPFALMARIAINLSCRHLLLVVRGILGINGNMVIISMIIVLELGVAIVQSFVFFLILSI